MSLAAPLVNQFSGAVYVRLFIDFGALLGYTFNMFLCFWDHLFEHVLFHCFIIDFGMDVDL